MQWVNEKERKKVEETLFYIKIRYSSLTKANIEKGELIFAQKKRDFLDSKLGMWKKQKCFE